MKKLCIVPATALLLSLAAGSPADTGASDTPQSLYLKAGKQEREGSMDRARASYEQIIDRFPSSDFAVKANDRLLELQRLPATSPVVTTTPARFASDSAAPLPEEPERRHAVNQARNYQQARTIIDNEIRRRQNIFTAQNGHRYSKHYLSEQQKEWVRLGEQRVRDELGSSIAVIEHQLADACNRLNLAAHCSENEILQFK